MPNEIVWQSANDPMPHGYRCVTPDRIVLYDAPTHCYFHFHRWRSKICIDKVPAEGTIYNAK